MRLRIVVIVLCGTAAIPVALLAPSWLDHRNNPHAVLSAHSIDLGSVPIGTPPGASSGTERLLTLRNDGHTTITEQGENIVLRNYKVVCPARLGSRRFTSCGFWSTSDPACGTLAPGATCALAIHFEPRLAHLYTARYCVEYVAKAQNWRHGETCLAVSGRGTV
jgi:hypothetical protein